MYQKIIQKIIFLVLLLFSLLYLQPSAHAVTINISLAPGSDSPNFDSNSTRLLAIANAAANYWEDIIQDSYTVDILVGYLDITDDRVAFACYFDLQTNNCIDGSVLPSMPTIAAIAFDTEANGAPIPWFFDPTPNNHSEFQLQQRLIRDLSQSDINDYYTGIKPDLVEAGYLGPALAGSTAANRIDAYSIALHEIGHVLGTLNEIALPESSDGDYDVNPAFIRGATMGVVTENNDGEHLRNPHTLMNSTIGIGRRVLPSATDIFAIAAGANPNWTNIDLPRKDFLAGSIWGAAGNWEGGRVPGSQDEVYIRHGDQAPVGLQTNRIARELVIAEESSLDVNDETLTITNDVSIGAANTGITRLNIDEGGLLQADNIRLRSGGRLSTIGSIFSPPTVEADRVEIESGGILMGTGRVAADDITNSGTVMAAIPVGSDTEVLVLETTGGDINLDGSENGQVIATSGSLSVSGPQSDEFDGEIRIGAGHTLFLNEPWILGRQSTAGGDIQLQGGPDNTSIATIFSSPWTAQTGQINVSGRGQNVGTVVFEEGIHVDVVDDGLFALAGVVTLNGGEYTGNGTIRFDGPVTVTRNTTMNTAFVDLDGANGLSAITLEEARLTLNVDRIDSSNTANRYDGTMNINGRRGALGVNLLDPDAFWQMDGELNLNGDTQQAGTSLNGNDIRITGTMNVSGNVRTGANLNISGTLTVNRPAQLTLGNGLHVVRDQATVGGSGTLRIQAPATLQIDDGATVGININNRGRIESGASIGLATIASNLRSRGTVAIQLGGLTPGTEYDQFVVDGRADLSGTLEVTLVDAGNGIFMPSIGDRFTILTADGGINGQFLQLQLPTDVGGQKIDWEVIYSSNRVRLRVNDITASESVRVVESSSL